MSGFGPLQRLLGVDWDDVFAYETFKIVRVRDRRLGMLHGFFVIGIIGWLIFDLLRDSKFLLKESPVGGYQRMTLKTPDIKFAPSYCDTTDTDLIEGCLYLHPDRVLDPKDQFFITTRVTVETLEAPEDCSLELPSRPECLPQEGSKSSYYVAGVEDMTIMLVHSMSALDSSLNNRNSAMNGELYDHSRQFLKRFRKHNDTEAQYEAEKRSPKVPGDIVTVRELLRAAGVADLNSIGESAQAKGKEETLRYAGLVIVILVEYQNETLDPQEISYKYYPSVIPGVEAKSIENIDPSTQWNRHGIRVVLVQTGQLGKFELLSFLATLAASIALFRVATIMVELLMLRVLPQKNMYTEYKYENTVDFSSIRGNDTKDRELQSGDQTPVDIVMEPYSPKNPIPRSHSIYRSPSDGDQLPPSLSTARTMTGSPLYHEARHDPPGARMYDSPPSFLHHPR